MSAAQVIATHKAAPIRTAPRTPPGPDSTITRTTVSNAMPEIGDQSVMPVHWAMMMPANQIQSAPTIAMIAARRCGFRAESTPLLLAESGSTSWACCSGVAFSKVLSASSSAKAMMYPLYSVVYDSVST